jgi:hypothetical protein
MSRVFTGFCLAAALALAACDSQPQKEVYHNPKVDPGDQAGSPSMLPFGGGKTAEAAGPAIGVNSYLWRASLDTISFMPLASADPFGGVIITDWYSPPETPSERFKVNVLILGRQLRSDGVRATVFRQSRAATGGWVDAPVDPKTQTDLENSILTRARELKMSTTAAK